MYMILKRMQLQQRYMSRIGTAGVNMTAMLDDMAGAAMRHAAAIDIQQSCHAGCHHRRPCQSTHPLIVWQHP